jgi:hypothetical protein
VSALLRRADGSVPGLTDGQGRGRESAAGERELSKGELILGFEVERLFVVHVQGALGLAVGVECNEQSVSVTCEGQSAGYSRGPRPPGLAYGSLIISFDERRSRSFLGMMEPPR